MHTTCDQPIRNLFTINKNLSSVTVTVKKNPPALFSKQTNCNLSNNSCPQTSPENLRVLDCLSIKLG